MDLRAKLQLVQQQPPKRVELPQDNIHELLPGKIITTASGSFFFTRTVFPAATRVGMIPLQECLTVTGASLALLAKDCCLEDWDWQKAVFLDTETTGLAGGTGTYAFLVGVGYFTSAGFTVDQYFMRGPEEENTMLNHLLQSMPERPWLVSFNGKSFDWPLLKTRFVLQGLGRRFPLSGHCDVLHAARRIWKRELPSCSLASLEKHILGAKRVNDIPSAEIPQVYFEYLKTRDAAPLIPVFEHNLQDVCSMVALLVRLGRLLSGAEKPTIGELLALGRLYETQQCSEQAVVHYRSVVKHCSDRQVLRSLSYRAMCRLSLLHKRQRQYRQAVNLWQKMTRIARDVFPYIELAKYYEHQLKDFDKAIKYVIDALDLLETRRALGGQNSERTREELLYRLNRLQRKKLRCNKDAADR